MKPLVRIAVRALVEHVLRSGDLVHAFMGPNRALEAIRIHQRIQNSRPTGYRAEVPVAARIETDALTLEVSGRIDGLFEGPDGTAIEEIKTTLRSPAEEAADERPLHWGQVRTYAAIWARQHDLAQVEVRLTLVHAASGEVQTLARDCPRQELDAFFDGLVARYLAWAEEVSGWQALRDGSLRNLAFPYGRFREGQRSMSVAVYRTLRRGGQLLVQAPTGIGKTMAALFPAVKALPEAGGGRLFYLTARTTGKGVAEAALAELRRAGARLKALTLTAKERLCPCPEAACSAEECPYARGYHDRVGEALRALFRHEALTRQVVSEAALAHRVCPFELSLELSCWMDVVIGDYNYAFDPQVFLRRHFAEEGAVHSLLVDEAHNLVDRAREMFSARLARAPLMALRRALKSEQPALWRSLGDITGVLLRWRRRCEAQEGLHAQTQPPEEIGAPLRRFQKKAELWLAQNRPAPYRADLLERYFEAGAFLRVLEGYDSAYATLGQASGADLALKLFCLDPAFQMRQALQRCRAAVLFSATLTPLPYFRAILGCDADAGSLALPSPFPPGNLGLFLSPAVSTLFRHRERTAGRLAEELLCLVRQRKGNYLLYFPSYAYLERVHRLFSRQAPEIETLVQVSEMGEAAREAFVGRFAADNAATLVGFAVMGGVFGEGIDLVGERLCGAAIVGVGLPAVCLERDLIREHFGGAYGFACAYLYPGINRVLQAAGRVIRSECDRGVVLLIDGRFGLRRYRALLPGPWAPRRVTSPAMLAGALRRFWSRPETLQGAGGPAGDPPGATG
jgi:DNA excision repair protein ERCC-2